MPRKITESQGSLLMLIGTSQDTMVGQEKNYVKRLQSQEDYGVDGGSKRRKSGDERSPYAHGTRDTVYRYLCPRRKVGSIIGRGGETVRQLMASTEARIIIGESIPGCEERLVKICSTSDESNAFKEVDRSIYVCPAQDALFKVHEKVFGNDPPAEEVFDTDLLRDSVRLLVSSDQIGHIIGKGGQTIHSIRNDTQAHIRILKNEHLPLCANSNDELIQITGEAPAVKKALFQVSARLHENPSGVHNLLGAYSTPSDSTETVYRCLCAERRIGSVIGKGGEIVNQLRADSQAMIIIGERVPGCRERVVTISSSSEKTNISGDMGDYVCPAEDALFRLHERLIKNDSMDDEDTVSSHASLSLLVPSDQIGHIIGKGGHLIQDIKSNSGANIRILKGEYVPPCANSDDELLQITGQSPNVMKALAQVSSCLRGRSSCSQSLLSLHDSRTDLQHGNAAGEFSSFHPKRDEGSSKMFALSLVCPSANIAKVIGKDGSVINMIREQSGASIKVDSSTGEDDCVILISGKEYLEDLDSSTIYAAVRLQPKCSEIAERGYGEPLYITRLLVPTSQIGCLIGKGGSIITEMRKLTRANIRVMSNESLLKVASEDDVLVEISGELAAARNALIQISTRLKAKVFRQDSAFAENSECDDLQGGGSP